jgi:hypothetical protein
MDRYFHSNARQLAVAHFVSLAILFAPALCLGVVSLEYRSPLLFIGAMAEILVACLVIRSREVWRPPASGLTIILYAMALGWLWLATGTADEPGLRLLRGGFILVAIALLVVHDLTKSGVEPRRKAQKLTRRLMARLHWPNSVGEFEEIPEIRQLHAAVRVDPSLAFVLVEDPRADVRIAGLMALQGRPYWRWDEASVVLKAARSAKEPEVRTLALAALHSASGAEYLRGLAPFLKDPSPDVRRCAAETMLVDGERRWAMIRESIRSALVEPTLVPDGPLLGAAGRLPAIALCDFTVWAVEPAPLAERAVRTLLAHYDLALQNPDHTQLPRELCRQITEEATPAVLRVELAHLLRKRGRIPVEHLDRMTDADQPGPIRLLAAEIMLSNDPHDHSGLNVLKGLGRQSNRDTAFAIARILQNIVGIDFGLPPMGITPTPKQTAEVTKKVAAWASGRTASEDALEFTPLPAHKAEGIFGPSSVPGMRANEGWSSRK